MLWPPHIPTAMKLLPPDSSALIAVMMISLGTGPAARSSNVTIDGSGFTDLNSSVRYFGGEVKQSGRFTSLGINHYRKAEFGVKWISNRSPHRTGNLGIELWAMPYYGADQGVVLMSRAVEPLAGAAYYFREEWKGFAILLRQKRFPEINLWEHTRKGWKWPDKLSLKQARWL